MNDGVCDNCSKPFTKVRSSSQFCSRYCSLDARKAKEAKIRELVESGEEMPSPDFLPWLKRNRALVKSMGLDTGLCD